MKRKIMLVLVGCLLVGLVGCGKEEATQLLPSPEVTASLSPGPSAVAVPTQTPTSIPTESPSASSDADESLVYQKIFNETYWLLNVSPSLSGNYATLFHSNGTFDAYNSGSGSYEPGTWSYENGKLFIDKVNKVEYILQNNGTGYISKEKQHAGAAGGDWSYTLDPDSSEQYDHLRSLYLESQQQLKEKEETTSTIPAPTPTPSPIASVSSLSDGWYTVRFYANKLNKSSSGSTLADVDVLANASYTDDYVQNLKIGDVLRAGKQEFEVKKLDSDSYAETEILTIDDGYYLSRAFGKTNWNLRTYDDALIRYVSKTTTLTIGPNVQITDDMSPYGYGLEAAKTVEGFFSQLSFAEYDAGVYVKEGVATEITFPYIP